MLKSVIVFVFFAILSVVIPASSTSIQYTFDTQPLSLLNDDNNNYIAPYMVSIKLNGVHICSGVIITSWDILTSAQCVYSFKSLPNKLFSIQAGSKNRYKDGSTYYAQSIDLHDSFKLNDCTLPDGNIARIRLSHPITFNDYCNRTCIGLKNIEKSAVINEEAIVGEWIDKKIETLNNLKLSNWSIISDEECNSYYSFMGNVTSNARLCGVNNYKDGDVSICPGDLGNPLMINGELVGIKSWRMGCNFPEAPVIFQNIRFYYDWIKAKSHGALC
ncbi:trypsin-3-like isoform X1 [Microplitis mediator]|uniref:trypsin-3-like isoform X1 n=1 Tax=Microplitis mediator TaxID=375433 RepID=UPI0025575E41|nr:trypsin-3-like isoform X1 [Microplitis mediator]